MPGPTNDNSRILESIYNNIMALPAPLALLHADLVAINGNIIATNGLITVGNGTLTSILARTNTTGVKVVPFDAAIWNPSFVMTYDANGRLSTIARTFGGTTLTKTLTYDANGRMVTASAWV